MKAESRCLPWARLFRPAQALPAIGASVNIGVRPQALRLQDGGTDIKLDMRERLGGVSYDYVSCPTGERLIVESRDDAALPSGTPVAISFDHSDVYVLGDDKDQRAMR